MHHRLFLAISLHFYINSRRLNCCSSKELKKKKKNEDAGNNPSWCCDCRVSAARHFTRTLSYCKRRGGWCESTPHGIVGAPLLFLPGVLWCALFKRAHVTVAASFKVRLPWICISQRLTGRAICRPKKKKKTMLTNKLAALHYPSPCSCFKKKKKTIPTSRKTKLFKNGALQLQNTQCWFSEAWCRDVTPRIPVAKCNNE